MAEGFLRVLGADVQSAGTLSHGLNPYAVKVMAEIGVDISGHKSKTYEQFLETQFEYVITVCDEADANCPYFPGDIKRVHHTFRDPAKFEGSEQEKLEVFSSVRDEIQAWSTEFMSKL